jgi:hypothetical protein
VKGIHIDCDRDGKDSIASLIAAGYIDTYKCVDHKAVEGIFEAIKRKQIQGDFIMVDTVNALISSINQGLLYTGHEGNVWEKRKSLKADWDTFRDTNNLTNYLNMLALNLSATGIPVIWIAHERNTKGSESRSDILSSSLGDDKYTADLQSGINSFLNQFATAIVRLTYSTVPFTLNGQAYPRGTRTLVLHPTRDSSVGTRVDGDWLVPNNPAPKPPLPEYMVVADRDPYAFYRFCEVMGRVPTSTLLYGPPKIGKTTFAAGAIYVPKG